MDNEFFRTAMSEEHNLVLANEKRLTKFEFAMLFVGAINLIFDLAVLIDCLFLGNHFWLDLPNQHRGEYIRFCILLSVFVIDPFWIICIAAKIWQLKKIKNHDYVVQNVMAVNISPNSYSFWKRTVKVTFMSNAGMIYVTDISEIAVKKIPLNTTGLLVRVNRSRRPLIYDECRYITIKHK